MTAGFAPLEDLPRTELLAVAHDYMLTGMLCGLSLTPMLTIEGAVDDVDSLPIPQWMGASPVYTRRLRDLMGIDGHGVADIMKALQLDVGFVHGYMDVAYRVDSPNYGEFWLLHCGALMDVEPFGEDQVVNMCHTIEDPTFDATALAHNPKARIRPIHRPPRTPADRHPHCHWTLAIDEANEPIGPIAHTDAVEALALSSVPNRVGDDRSEGRLHDYRGEFEPGFRLSDLTSGALAAVAREFQLQSHLLEASQYVEVVRRAGDAVARRASDAGWATFGWLLAERLAKAFDLGEGVDAVARGIQLTAAFPPGFDREVTVDGDRITVRFTPTHAGLLDPAHAGWCGSMALGAPSGLEGTIGGLGYDASEVEVSVDSTGVTMTTSVTPSVPDRPIPDFVQLAHGTISSTWDFGTLVEIRR